MALPHIPVGHHHRPRTWNQPGHLCKDTLWGAGARVGRRERRQSPSSVFTRVRAEASCLTSPSLFHPLPHQVIERVKKDNECEIVIIIAITYIVLAILRALYMLSLH